MGLDLTIEDRLNDNVTLERLVYEVFYAGPIAYARQNLVIAFQRHLRGQPLVTAAEAQTRMLDALSEDARKAWWVAHNAQARKDALTKAGATPDQHAGERGE